MNPNSAGACRCVVIRFVKDCNYSLFSRFFVKLSYFYILLFLGRIPSSFQSFTRIRRMVFWVVLMICSFPPFIFPFGILKGRLYIVPLLLANTPRSYFNFKAIVLGFFIISLVAAQVIHLQQWRKHEAQLDPTSRRENHEWLTRFDHHIALCILTHNYASKKLLLPKLDSTRDSFEKFPTWIYLTRSSALCYVPSYSYVHILDSNSFPIFSSFQNYGGHCIIKKC